VNKGDLDLSHINSESQKNDTEQNKEEVKLDELVGLLDAFRTHLSEEIKEVKISKRLHESPCCLVSEDGGMSSYMERIMKASGQSMPASKKILEVNPSHPLIQNLANKKNSNSIKEDVLSEWINTLYDTALLSEGSPVKNPGTFARRLTKMMESASASL